MLPSVPDPLLHANPPRWMVHRRRTTDSDDDDHTPLSRKPSAAAKSWRVRRFGEYSIQDVLAFKRMYHEIDQDGSGTINIEEFMNSDSFRSSQMFFMSKSVFKSLDKDGSGDIEIDELLPVVFPLVRCMDAHTHTAHTHTHTHTGSLTNPRPCV